MHVFLKLAFQKGHAQALKHSAPDDVATVKEAVDWQTAAKLLDPIKGTAHSIAEAARALRTGAKKRALSQYLAAGGLGAGVGALASDEQNRGRGALVGALGGLGLGLGARIGGVKGLEKTLESVGEEASKLIRQRKLEPAEAAIGEYMKKQLFSEPLKQRTLGQIIGASLLGSLGLGGGTMLGKHLFPRREIQYAPSQAAYPYFLEE